MRNFGVIIALCALIGISLSAYDTNTVALHDNLETCVSDTESDIDCMTSVQDGLQTISDTIQTVRDLKTALTSIVNGLSTLDTVTSIASYAPAIGTAVKILDKAIAVLKTPLTSAKSTVTTIDNAIYKWKDEVDDAIETIEKAVTYEGYLNGNCTNGESIVSTAKTCVDSMSSGTVKTTAEDGLEAFGAALNPSFTTLNSALGNIGTACATAKEVTDLVSSWPDLSELESALKDITDAIDPVLTFFEDFQDVLDTKFCITNPLEEIAETEIAKELAETAEKVAEGTKEVGKEAAETAEEGKEGVCSWGICGKKRRKRSLTASETSELQQLLKKSLSDLTVTENKANTLLTSKRASDICFSVQDILDGINSAFDALLGFADDAIDALLEALPSFTLPGLPDLDVLDFNYSFDLPELDFGWDFDLYAQFDYLTFNCASSVTTICQAVSGGISVDCSLSLDQYEATFGKRSLASNLTRRGLSKKKKIHVKLPAITKYDRKDDKKMTPDEGKAKFMSLSPEGREKLAAMLREKGIVMENGQMVKKPKKKENDELKARVARMLKALGGGRK